MANNEIDSLSIGIQVNDNNSVAKLNEMSKAIDSLVSSLDGLKKMQGVLETLERTFKGVSSSSGRAAKKIVVPNVAPPQYATADISTAVGQLPKISSSTTQSLQEISDVIKTQINLITEDEHSIDRLRIAVGKLDGTYNLSGESAKEAAKAFGYVEKATQKATKSTDKSASAFSKFTRSVGRIAFYRAIRTALKEITQAMQEGLQNYVRYNSATNKAMSGVMNARNQLVNTLGATLGQLMQTFGPVLERLAEMATGLFDSINMALASLSGKSTYSKAIKQNEDYAKSLDKVNGKLLSFDTFNTLASSGTSPKDLYEEVALPEQLDDTTQIIKDVAEILQSVGSAITDIVKALMPLLKDLMPVIKLIIDNILKSIQAILPFIVKIVEALIPIVESIAEIASLLIETIGPALNDVITIIEDVLQTIGPAIKSVLQVISGIIKLATGDWKGAFEDFGESFKNMWYGIANSFAAVINFIANGFINLVNFLIDVLNVILKPLDWIASIFGGQVQIGHWDAHVDWTPYPNYANGGSFNTADMFYANENGQTELIASTNNGGAVMNTEQLQEAIYTGMAMAMSERGGQEVVLKVDQNTLGRVVANSSGFINETNRIKLIKV